jgi:hypothetical protein
VREAHTLAVERNRDGCRASADAAHSNLCQDSHTYPSERNGSLGESTPVASSAGTDLYEKYRVEARLSVGTALRDEDTDRNYPFWE